MYDVFVSYSREDRKRVAGLVEAFISLRGWSVWWDEQLQAGSRFTGEIEGALTDSRCVLVVWSEHAVQSDWVRAEADEGRKRGVLIPVRLDACQLPLPFGQTETADLHAWDGSERAPELLALIDEVQRVIAAGTAPGTDELVAREARQRALRRRRVLRRFTFSVTLLIGIIGAGFGYLSYTQRADAENLSKRLAGTADALREQVLARSAEEEKYKWGALLFEGGKKRLGKLQLSILLAIEAMRTAPTEAAQHALRQGLVLLPFPDWSLKMHRAWTVASALDFSHDGRLLAAGGGRAGTLIWDYRNGKVVTRIEHGGTTDHNGSTTDRMRETFAIWEDKFGIQYLGRGPRVIDFSPVENLLATAGLDGTARLWDAESGRELRRLRHQETVVVVQFSPDGQMLATASYDGTARLWDTHSGKELVRLPHDDALREVEFSSSGNYVATASRSGSTRVWSTATGEELAQVDSENKVAGIRFGPHEKLLAVFDGSTDTTLWDWKNRELIWKLPAYNGGDTGVIFNPAGDRIVTGGTNGELSWWDIDRRELLFSVKAGGYISRIAASANRDRMVTLEYRTDTAQAWDVSAGRELERMQYRTSSRSVAISADGELLASCGLSYERDHDHTGIIEVTNIWPENPIVAACNRLRFNMTRKQWHNYMGDQPYRLTCPEIGEPEQQ